MSFFVYASSSSVHFPFRHLTFDATPIDGIANAGCIIAP
jgi:hypothetical protein